MSMLLTGSPLFPEETFTDKTDQEWLDYGNEAIVKTQSDKLVSYNDIATQNDPNIAEKLYQAILKTDRPGTAQLFLSPGLQLNLSWVQQQLTDVAANTPEIAELCQALKREGITWWSRWESWGVEAFTLDQITEMRKGPTEHQKIACLMNNFINPYLNDPNRTLQGFIDGVNDPTNSMP